MKSKFLLLVLVIATILGTSLTLSYDFITNKTISIAHRGFGLFNKNSTSSFKSAKQFDAIECDVWITADNEFVISHDQSISTKNGDLIIAETTLNELKNHSKNLLTIDNYINICKSNNNRCTIDIKPYILTEQQISLLLQKLRNYQIEETSIILSYSPEVINQFNNKTTAELFFIFDTNNPEFISFCINNKINACVKTNVISKELVQQFHNNGLKINAWTVNNIFSYMYLSTIGVDYITSDILF